MENIPNFKLNLNFTVLIFLLLAVFPLIQLSFFVPVNQLFSYYFTHWIAFSFISLFPIFSLLICCLKIFRENIKSINNTLAVYNIFIMVLYIMYQIFEAITGALFFLPTKTACSGVTLVFMGYGGGDQKSLNYIYNSCTSPSGAFSLHPLLPSTLFYLAAALSIIYFIISVKNTVQEQNIKQLENIQNKK